MIDPGPETEFEEIPPKTGHDLQIDVLGTSFIITTGEDPEYLKEVLAQYEFMVAQTQGISGKKDPLKVAILTGFLLCDEINKLKLQVKEDRETAGRQQADDEGELDRITGNLIACIDEALDKIDLTDG